MMVYSPAHTRLVFCPFKNLATGHNERSQHVPTGFANERDM